METPNETATPSLPAEPPKTIRIELEYFLAQQRLIVKAKCATILLEGALFQALMKPYEGSITAPMPADGVVRVAIDCDLATGDVSLEAQAPNLIVRGVLLHAIGSITRNQAQQWFQNNLKPIEARLAAIEDVKRKIILPS